MEKADVLDLTVNYLKSAQCTKKHQENATDAASYQAGYRECQDHINRVLITDPTMNANQKSQIISHFVGVRPPMTLNLPRPVHAFLQASPYPIQSHFATTTPPPSPIPSPTARHPVSPMEGLTLLSHTAELKPKRMSHSESPTRTDVGHVWRPWQAGTSGRWRDIWTF